MQTLIKLLLQICSRSTLFSVCSGGAVVSLFYFSILDVNVSVLKVS